MEKLADAVVDVEFESGNNIQEKGKHSEAALYLIREGTVSIMGTDIYAGGYFGDEQLLADAKGTADRAGYIVPDLTVKCATNVVCGVLSLKECRLLFDTTKIDIGDKKEEDYNFRSSNILKRRSTIRESFKTNSITMKDLKRQDMLGEGAFGEVWLVKADVWGLGEEEYMEEFALKVQNLDNPDHDNMADIVKREMDVISSLEHPFIVDMVTSQEVENESLMLMSVVRGGELWGVLHKEQDDGSWLSGIAEPDAKFYALIIADTIAYMHQKNIIFRDLKPENVLIDKDGYPNIIDFGFAKFCKDKTYTFCGTPNYVAPEIILSTGHGVGVDHWALGIMIYEMVAGENPFYYDGVDNGTLFEIIVKEEPFPSEKASESLQSLLNGLLEKDPTQRLGNLAGNERDILRHKWFEELDLELLRNKMVDAPWIPPIERND
jgi:serine/threonine protein kinase